MWELVGGALASGIFGLLGVWLGHRGTLGAQRERRSAELRDAFRPILVDYLMLHSRFVSATRRAAQTRLELIAMEGNPEASERGWQRLSVQSQSNMEALEELRNQLPSLARTLIEMQLVVPPGPMEAALGKLDQADDELNAALAATASETPLEPAEEAAAFRTVLTACNGWDTAYSGLVAVSRDHLSS